MVAGVNINTVIIGGMLSRDPEERTFSNGGMIVQFGIGFLESSWFDKDTKKWKYKNGFLDVKKSLSGNYAKEQAEKIMTLAKGMHVIIEGKLGFEQWDDKNGGKRSKVVLVASKITPLNATSSEPAQRSGTKRPPSRAGRNAETADDAPPPDDEWGEASGGDGDGLPF